ncbi:hypothetical protein IGI04_012017, partial [Brassica rapa subsp. trilocularis]
NHLSLSPPPLPIIQTQSKRYFPFNILVSQISNIIDRRLHRKNARSTQSRPILSHHLLRLFLRS